MDITEIKERLSALAKRYHERDLSDPAIRARDPEGFLIEWDALELIAEYAVLHKLRSPGFEQEKIQKVYNSISEDARVFLWQHYLSKCIETAFNPEDTMLDKGFREIVLHYIEAFGK